MNKLRGSFQLLNYFLLSGPVKSKYSQLCWKSPKNNLLKNFALLGFTSFGISYLAKIHTLRLDDAFEINIKDDLEQDERRLIQVGPRQQDTVMFLKADGVNYCISTFCFQHGGQMEFTPVNGNRITCPYHNISYSLQDGSTLNGPSFCGLSVFPVQIKQGKINALIQQNQLNKGEAKHLGIKGSDQRRFVIIGGGAAGLSAAETLRKNGFQGQITILTKEPYLPYDKTGMSKLITKYNIKSAIISPKQFLQENGIDVKTEVEIQLVNSTQNYVQTSDGTHFHYEKLLIATGASPQKPKISGLNTYSHIHTLRDFSDLQKIRQSLQSKQNIIIVGSSFIGLESASSIKSELKQKVNITIVDRNSAPFEETLGTQIGKSIKKLAQKNGISFKFNSGLKEVSGDINDNIQQITLEDGTSLNADLLILATGVEANTKFLSASTFAKSADNGLITNEYLKTSVGNVYAAGDVATVPVSKTENIDNLRHFNQAIYQGYIAGLNMMQKDVPLNRTPYFWTQFFDNTLQYTGYAQEWDDIYIDGDVEKQKYLVWYFNQNRVVAAAGMGFSEEILTINNALNLDILPNSRDIKAQRVTVKDIQNKMKILQLQNNSTSKKLVVE